MIPLNSAMPHSCAGVAGLSCAKHLQSRGINFSILEAADDVGGRVRSDKLDGFILDRGFQIFLTSYPTAKAMLDYDALNLQPFYAGLSSHASLHEFVLFLSRKCDGVRAATRDCS